MARVRTLANLRAEVRARADIENDPHVTDTEVDRFINQSIARLHVTIVQACEDDYVTSYDLTTVAGTEEYQIAAVDQSSDFYKLISVDATINGVTRQIDRFTWNQRARLLNVGSWGMVSQPIMYRLVGWDRIRFAPVPDAAYSVTIWYVPASVDLTVDSSEYDGRDGWEEWVVLDAAIKCKLKSEESITDLERERAEVMTSIVAAFGTKDQARPESVQEVRGQGLEQYGLVAPVWVR